MNNQWQFKRSPPPSAVEKWLVWIVYSLTVISILGFYVLWYWQLTSGDLK